MLVINCTLKMSMNFPFISLDNRLCCTQCFHNCQSSRFASTDYTILCCNKPQNTLTCIVVTLNGKQFFLFLLMLLQVLANNMIASIVGPVLSGLHLGDGEHFQSSSSFYHLLSHCQLRGFVIRLIPRVCMSTLLDNRQNAT